MNVWESLPSNWPRFLRMVHAALLVAVCVVNPALLTAQCVDYEEYLHVTGSLEFQDYVIDVASEGEVASIIVDTQISNALYIIDISNPDDPSVTNGPIRGDFWLLEMNGELLYALGGGGLSIYDLTDPYNPVLLSSLSLPGEGLDLTVSMDHVFVADGSAGLQVIDVSDVANPFIAGSNMSRGDLERCVVVGSMVYIWGPTTGLNVFEISDPVNPSFRSSIPSINSVEDMDVQDNVLVFVHMSTMSTWEISTLDPTVVSQVGFLGHVLSNKVAFNGDYIFLSSDYQQAIFVVDASDISSPYVCNRIGIGDQPVGFGFFEDYLFVGGRRYFLSIDIGSIYPPSWSLVPGVNDDMDIDVVNNLAVCVGSDLTVVDISDVNNFRVLGRCSVPGSCQEVKIKGNYAYVATTIGLSIVNIQNPEIPFCSGGLATAGTVNGVDIDGSIAYLVDSRDGLIVVDVRNTISPAILGRLDVGYSLNDVAVSGGFAYLTNLSAMLYIADISDPCNPTLISESRSGSRVVALSGDLLFMGGITVWDRVSVVDVKEPCNPVVLAQYPMMDYVRDLEIRGDFLFVADSRGGLQICDIRYPDAMKVVGNLCPDLDIYTGGIMGVATNTKRLFYVELGKGMKVALLPCTAGALDVDIASGEEPRLVPMEGGIFPYTISVSNQSSAGIWAGIRIEATFPDGTDHFLHERPAILFPTGYTVGSLNLYQTVPSKAPAGEYIYRCIVDPGGGFEVSDEFIVEKLDTQGMVQDHPGADFLDWTLTGWDGESPPSDLASPEWVVHSCRPNPFNPATVLSFELQEPGPLTLQIYDVAGRSIRSLVAGAIYDSGHHEVVWNGRDDRGAPAPAGVYFYRLGFEGEWQAGRMVMVK